MKKGIVLGGLLALACNVSAVSVYFNEMEAQHGAEVGSSYSGISMSGFVFDKTAGGSLAPYDELHYMYSNPERGVGFGGGITLASGAVGSLEFSTPVRELHLYGLLRNNTGTDATFTATAYNSLGEVVGIASAVNYTDAVLGDYNFVPLAILFGDKFNRPDFSRIDVSASVPFGIDSIHVVAFIGGEYVGVPDGGETVELLALGLIGLCGVRRHLKAAI